MSRAVVVYEYNGTDNFVNIIADKFKINDKQLIALNQDEIVGGWNIGHIDREKLIKELIDKGFYPAIVKSAIENAPTEDVVPRKQSENWKEIAIAYQKQFEDTYEDKQMAIKQAEQKVAREIIEHFISKKERLRQAEYHQQDMDDFFLRPLEFWDYIDNFVGLTGEEILAELKKKYIGE